MLLCSQACAWAPTSEFRAHFAHAIPSPLLLSQAVFVLVKTLRAPAHEAKAMSAPAKRHQPPLRAHFVFETKLCGLRQRPAPDMIGLEHVRRPECAPDQCAPCSKCVRSRDRAPELATSAPPASRSTRCATIHTHLSCMHFSRRLSGAGAATQTCGYEK